MHLKGKNSQSAIQATPSIPKLTSLVCGLIIGTIIGLFIYKYETKPHQFLSPVGDGINAVVVRETFEQRRHRQISAYLQKYNSPLLPYTFNLVASGVAHGIDPLLLVAISKRESSLGKLAAYNNPFGYGGTKLYRFSSYPEAIEFVAERLENSVYYKEFRKSNDYIDLARRYCADVSPETYANFIKETVETIEKI